jgi:hypothetical protein
MSNGRDLKHILERIYNHESLMGIDLQPLSVVYEFYRLRASQDGSGGLLFKPRRDG